MAGVATTPASRAHSPYGGTRLHASEQQRAGNYPLSRYWLRPLAGRLAASLVFSPIRPWHLSLCGVAAAGAAAALLVSAPQWATLAAPLVLLAWFFDRADGQLARCQHSASPLGAWLDANFDELIDVGLQVAVAAAAASMGSTWAWPLLVAFLAGKYLLMYGLLVEDATVVGTRRAASADAVPLCAAPTASDLSLGKRLYHLPGNADVRVHVLALALLSGWLTAELVYVAIYYNLRWLARYPLMTWKHRGAAR